MRTLRFDHASINVASFHRAVSELDQVLGLSVSISPDAPDRHGRIFFEGCYLEISSHQEAVGWSVPLYFLGFEDLESLQTRLAHADIEFDVDEYLGVDGTWDNVELSAGTVPLPILVRRKAPIGVSLDWPPSKGEDHRCGATSIDALHINVPDLHNAKDVFARLLQDQKLPIELKQGGRPGVAAIVFKANSYETTRAELGNVFDPPDSNGVAWVTDARFSGVRLGFVFSDRS